MAAWVTSQADEMTLDTWLNEWLDTYKKGKVSDNTFSLYSDCVRMWINDSLKKTTLRKYVITHYQLG